MSTETKAPEITQHARDHIRTAHADLMAAIKRAEATTRPDGTDGGGHPGIEAANLEGYLGRYALPLLNALEAAEERIRELSEPPHVRGENWMSTHAVTHAPPGDVASEVFGRGADLWYCPVCGYIDPKTHNTRCPRPHAPGTARPLFRQAVYGYFIRVGIEEAGPVQDVRGDQWTP